MPLYPCSVCGKPVEKPEAWRKRNHHVFCSDKCQRTPFIPKRCEICGATFYVTAQSATTAKFCSSDCRNTRNRVEQVHKKAPKITRTCQQCGKQFDVRKSVGKDAMYCSKACFFKSGKMGGVGPDNPHWKPKVTLTCAYCGKEFEAHQSRNDGRKKYCCQSHRMLGMLRRIASGERTDIERAMASALRASRIAFSEQVVMFDKFMVDFKLVGYPIIIQCDGAYWHNRPKTKAKDKGQDAYLVKAGYVVLRFTDHQVLHEMSTCIQAIKKAIKNPKQPRLLQE